MKSKVGREELEAAKELAASDEYLKDDARTQEVLKEFEEYLASDGDEEKMTEAVRKIEDLGKFLVGRRAFIMQEIGKAQMSRINPEMLSVIHSVSPNVEKYIDGGK